MLVSAIFADLFFSYSCIDLCVVRVCVGWPFFSISLFRSCRWPICLLKFIANDGKIYRNLFFSSSFFVWHLVSLTCHTNTAQFAPYNNKKPQNSLIYFCYARFFFLLLLFRLFYVLIFCFNGLICVVLTRLLTLYLQQIGVLFSLHTLNCDEERNGTIRQHEPARPYCMKVCSTTNTMAFDNEMKNKAHEYAYVMSAPSNCILQCIRIGSKQQYQQRQRHRME